MNRIPRRSRRGALVLVGIALALSTACTPPTAPGPTVREQPADRGKVEGPGASAGCAADVGSALPTGRSVLRVPTDTGLRTVLVDVPPGLSGSDPAPVLLSLHPFAVDATGWDLYSGLSRAAVARGYVVLTPKGSEPGPRWAVPGGLDTGIDDIGFLAAALDAVEDRACVDRNAEFAAGFSAGAAMAQALSCTMPWRFAAVFASGGANLTETCPASPATDSLVLHGSADPIAPATGSTVVFAPPLGLHVDEVVATNAARAGCDPVPETWAPYPSVIGRRFVGCDVRIEHWTMVGSGHTWAGAEIRLDALLGPTNTEFSATETALDFFDGAIG